MKTVVLSGMAATGQFPNQALARHDHLKARGMEISEALVRAAAPP
jgi:hypothetical protein